MRGIFQQLSEVRKAPWYVRSVSLEAYTCRISLKKTVDTSYTARNLWKATAEITGTPIKDIYTGKEIPLESLSIDHFVPRSFISNDELWNLTPMNRGLNSSKNNKLPAWDVFFEPFAKYQFHLYSLVFPKNNDENSIRLRKYFEKCRKNNLNSIWASEMLYIPGNTDVRFINILDHNLKPIYEAAQLQGYDAWSVVNL